MSGEAIKVEVERSPLRCPFCHSDVKPESDAWLACAACLARHHEGCWREGGGRCASCGAARVLAEASVVAVDGEEVQAKKVKKSSRSRVKKARETLGQVAFLVGFFYAIHITHSLCDGVILGVILGAIARYLAHGAVSGLVNLVTALTRKTAEPDTGPGRLRIETLRARAEEHAARNEIERALELYHQLLELDPGDGPAGLRVRTLLAQRGEVKGA